MWVYVEIRLLTGHKERIYSTLATLRPDINERDITACYPRLLSIHIIRFVDSRSRPLGKTARKGRQAVIM